MTEIQMISTRNVLRDYKKLVTQIQKTNQPIIVMNQNKPQLALVSLKTLEELQAHQKTKKNRSLLDLAGLIPKGSGLPKDLAQKHSTYAWE